MIKNTNIVAAGEKFNIGCRVVLWDEEEGFSFYKNGNLYKRNLNLEDLRKVLTCFVVHYSCTYRASHMYNGLNARGLSCNFMIDDDINEDGCATIYQCADIKDACWTQGHMNKNGPGVEISYFPDVWTKNYYSQHYQDKYGVQAHKIVSDTVHGYKFKRIYAPTDAQVEACARLMWGYTNLFPDIKPKFPRDKNGKLIKTVLKTVKTYKGLINHFNITRSKPDTAGFPFEQVEQRMLELQKEFDKKNKEPKIGEVSSDILKDIVNYLKKK